MFICKVVGSIWATRKEDHLKGLKFLVVKPEKVGLAAVPQPVFIAVDRIGAGIGDQVIVTKGTPASFISDEEKLPIDALVIGIVDSIDIGNGDNSD
jgi:ethanolamine utilization protein EutN